MAAHIWEDGDPGERVQGQCGDRQIRLTRKSAAYWVATFNNPPLNIVGSPHETNSRTDSRGHGQFALANTTASAEPLRIRGTIVATSSDSITVHTANGDVTASLNAKTGFVSAVPSNLTSVGPGSYLRVASKAAGDKVIALSVIVFPPAMNGVAEGNAVYDPLPDTTLFGGTRTVSSMTNANVKSISPGGNAPRVNSAMTKRQRRNRDAQSRRREVCNLDLQGRWSRILSFRRRLPVVAFVPGYRVNRHVGRAGLRALRRH